MVRHSGGCGRGSRRCRNGLHGYHRGGQTVIAWAALPDAERIRILEADVVNMHIASETREKANMELATKNHELYFANEHLTAENLHLREALLNYAHGELLPMIAKKALEWKAQRPYQ
jgi:hypothetical protein